MKNRFTEEQIIGVLKEAETFGPPRLLDTGMENQLKKAEDLRR